MDEKEKLNVYHRVAAFGMGVAGAAVAAAHGTAALVVGAVSENKKSAAYHAKRSKEWVEGSSACLSEGVKGRQHDYFKEVRDMEARTKAQKGLKGS